VRTIVPVDPFKCRIWSLHDRFATEIDDQSCKAEIESISAHGQIVAALGRRLVNDPDHDVEIVCGARRLFAARRLNKPLLVELRDFTDREGLVAMDIENRQRRDISPYERGLGYTRWLRSGHFESQDDLSRTLTISASQVSRLLQLARLPAVVVNAFRDPAEIRENWGLELVAALDDPQRRAATIRTARSLCDHSPRPQSRDVIRKLLSVSARGRKPKVESHDKVVPGRDGAALFRIRYLSKIIALVFAAERVSEEAIERIEMTLTSILQRTGEQRRHDPRYPLRTVPVSTAVTIGLGAA
jgi:ParB family chromosome partitioning protein